MKGARWMKIDPNFQSPSFCKTQERVPVNDPRGCFVRNLGDISQKLTDLKP
jgi:hypothetical protein